MLLEQLPRLGMPVLAVQGEYNRIFPVSQAREAVTRLRVGYLDLIPDCGTCPARTPRTLRRFPEPVPRERVDR